MKFFSAIILTAILGYAAPLYFEWWSIAITSMLVPVVIHQTPLKSFLAGFTGIFLLWGIDALIIDSNNNHILSSKIAFILPLGGSSALLILITAIIGGLVGGLAALTGSFAVSIKE